jgi:hypothetical protein
LAVADDNSVLHEMNRLSTVAEEGPTHARESGPMRRDHARVANADDFGVIMRRGVIHGTPRAANDDDFSAKVKRGGGALALQQTPPWQSRAVLRLANAVRRPNKGKLSGEQVEPMLVEGPRGTSLRALGCKEDHRVAGDALSRVMAEQRERRSRGGLDFLGPSNVRPPRDRAFEAEDVPVRSIATRPRHGGTVFGAVYEHCDSTGRPKIISSTKDLPEQQFLEDGKNHHGVADLLTRGRGSSRVVWAGVGQQIAGIGENEMGVIRQAIVDDRSKRLHVQKLSGIKPYSAHGW